MVIVFRHLTHCQCDFFFAGDCTGRISVALGEYEYTSHTLPCAPEKFTWVSGFVTGVIASYGVHPERDVLLVHLEKFCERFICYDIRIHAFTT